MTEQVAGGVTAVLALGLYWRAVHGRTQRGTAHGLLSGRAWSAFSVAVLIGGYAVGAGLALAAEVMLD